MLYVEYSVFIEQANSISCGKQANGWRPPMKVGKLDLYDQYQLHNPSALYTPHRFIAIPPPGGSRDLDNPRAANASPTVHRTDPRAE